MVQPMRTQNGGSGGVVICLGVGALVDMSEMLGLVGTDDEDDVQNPFGGVEVWLIDARRPWNVGNVFSGNPQEVLGEVSGNAIGRAAEVVKGKIQSGYRPGQGGVVVFDDGDVEEGLGEEGEAYLALMEMGEVEDLDDDDDDEDTDERRGPEEGSQHGDGLAWERSSKKRKSWSDRDE